MIVTYCYSENGNHNFLKLDMNLNLELARPCLWRRSLMTAAP